MLLLMKMMLIFSPRAAAWGGVDRLRHADGGEVAVALVDEHDLVGVGALDARRDGGRAAVGGLLHVAVEVVVREHRAADGRDADALILHAQLFDALRDQPVHDAVRAAGAVMQVGVGQHFGFLKDFHQFASAFLSDSSAARTISSSSGTFPPVRP